jgi:hypothetical protein
MNQESMVWWHAGTRAVAFAGRRRVAEGELRDVALRVKAALDAGEAEAVLVFDEATSQPIELDLRGTAEEAAGRLREPEARRPGRPKLGVVAREVTLLPRHWEWLNAQPGGASVALRKLVDQARKEGARAEEVRVAREVVYRFVSHMAGNEPGYEEALRALYQGDRERFRAETEAWAVDVRDHARQLAEGAF